MVFLYSARTVGPPPTHTHIIVLFSVAMLLVYIAHQYLALSYIFAFTERNTVHGNRWRDGRTMHVQIEKE